MSNKPLLGVGQYLIPIPRYVIAISRLAWEKTMTTIEARLDSLMSKEHHLVRDFVVGELPRVGSPLSPELISERLDLSVDWTKTILDKLEHMTLLDKNEQGAVAWAYPVTVEKTPHCATFSSGEQTHIP